MEEELNFDIQKVKKYILPALLVAFIIFAFYLRAYHMDYPVIGYHNWKEVRYITAARNFINEGYFKYGFFIPAYDYPGIHKDPSGYHGDFFPWSAIFPAIFMSIFGMELWAARLPGILLSTATVLVSYLMMMQLFKRKDLALTTAFLVALNPLFVFFGRNVQQMGYGLFFLLLGIYYYARWVNNENYNHLVLGSLFFIAGVISKYTFGILAIPCLAIFPWSRLKNAKENLKHYVLTSIPGVLILLWYLYSEHIQEKSYLWNVPKSQLGGLGFKALFVGNFIPVMKSFAADNYTLIGLLFAFLGLLLIIYFFITRRNLGIKFMFWYFIGTIVFFFMVAGNLMGHNYHQYPIAMMVIMSIAFFSVFIGSNAKPLLALLGFKNEQAIQIVKIGLIIIVLAFLIKPSFEAKNRMFDTQFPGLDIAGEYIKSHKYPGERVMHSSHQAYGLLWHGDIKGTRGIPPDITSIKYAEENLSANWLFIYNWDFKIFQEERWQYLSERYGLRQVALADLGNGQMAPMYLLLYRDDNGFNISMLNDYIMNKPVEVKTYEKTTGPYELRYANIVP